MLLHGVDKHGFEDLAWTTPVGSSLDQHWPRSILQSTLPIFHGLHFLDVFWLVLKPTGREVSDLVEAHHSTHGEGTHWLEAKRDHLHWSHVKGTLSSGSLWGTSLHGSLHESP